METKIPDKERSVKKEDSLTNLIGDFGKWQLIVLGTVSLVKLNTGWVQLAILFLTPNLTFRCISLPNSTVDVQNSTCYEGCLKYEYDTSPFDNTIVSEWDLVCERRWLASFTQTMLQAGILVGSSIFGFFSDRYGRKITFLVAVTTVVIIGMGVPFSPNYTVFTVLRTLQGAATAGTMVVSFVIIMESVGPRYREMAGCLYQLPFIIGHISMTLFAFYFRSWNSYMLAMAIPTLVYLGYFLVLSETPRWLVSVGRVDDATRVVTKAARMNNLPTEKIKETLTQLSQDLQANSDKPKLNYTAIFQRGLLLKTVCCCFIWLVTGVSYFGFNQYISQTSPDPFISVALAGVIQIPSNIGSIWLIKILGRRFTLSASCILGGVFVIILHFVPNVFAATLTLGSLGVSCAAICAFTMYIYTSELYPTVVRNMGMGACSTTMRIGSMVAPFISNTSATIPWLPTAVFGLAPIAAGLVCLLLPETKGRNLPDSIEDIRNED